MRTITFRLRPSIVMLFIGLVVPLFALLVALTYYSNERAASRTAEEMVDRFSQEVHDSLRQLLDPVTTLVRTAGTTAGAFPEVLRSDRGFGVLEEMLDHSRDIAGVYMGFEDGSFRAVYRAAEGMKFLNQPSPKGAVRALRWIDRGGRGPAQDVITFLDADRRPLETRRSDAAYDPRKRGWYSAALAERRTVLSGPYVFASSGQVGISLAQAVAGPAGMQGVVAADLSLDTLEGLLKSRQISPRSVSLILDDQQRVVASSTSAGPAASAETPASVRLVKDLSSHLPAIALGLMPRQGGDRFQFDDPVTGERHVARLSEAAARTPTGWKVLIAAPMSDFLVDIRQNNQRMALLGVLAIGLQLLVIYLLSSKLARPLETMASRVAEIEQLRFAGEPLPVRSKFSEVRLLANSIERMSKAIEAFSAFVPIELVRALMKSEGRLELGGHSRFLTIMFCDLESFSTLSENSPSQELLLRVSKYLEVATAAINEELGTVDKFIGDGVMAFWGAPVTIEDHAWRACVAALKIQERMDALNRDWVAQGLPPLNVRIGIHSDSVLVGNIGSPQRMSYTVMGDGVNVAARLEGINKELGTRICVSKAVFREAGERIVLRPLDDVTVKGRKAPVSVYELLGVRQPGPAPAPAGEAPRG